ncbi:hypothetical protein [Salana multivorans]
MVLALAAGRPVDGIIDAQRDVYLERMRTLTAARRDGDVLDRIAVDFEIAHLEADLYWIARAGARVGELREGIAATLGGQS